MDEFTKGISFYWSADTFTGGFSSFNAVHEDGSETPILCPQSMNDGDDGRAWFATVEDADEQGLAKADMELIETTFKTATKLAEMGYDAVKVLDVLPMLAYYIDSAAYRKAFNLLKQCRGDV